MNKNNQLINICHHEEQSCYGKINELSHHNISRLNETKTKHHELRDDPLRCKQIQHPPDQFNQKKSMEYIFNHAITCKCSRYKNS